MSDRWPTSDNELIAAQSALAEEARAAPRYVLEPGDTTLAGGCFLAYARGEAGPGGPGDRAWAAAVTWRIPSSGSAAAGPRRPDRPLTGSGPRGPRQARDVREQVLVPGRVPAGYRAGLLALREGPLLEAAVRSLHHPPDVLLVDATGTDHPRRAGLAVHLGAVVGLPTVGVTHRPLIAVGDRPVERRGAIAPVSIEDEVVGYWVCTRTGARPVVAHAGWRTDPDTAVAVVLACSTEGARTPVPLGEARRVAREARAIAEGRVQVSR